MSKGTKIGIIAGSAALVVLLIVCIAIGVASSGPETLLLTAISNTVKDAKSIDTYEMMDSVLNGGSISVTADLAQFTENEDVADFAMMLYTDADGVDVSGTATLTTDTDSYDISGYFNKKSIVLQSDAAWSGNAYGFDVSDIAENLPDSVFDPDEKTEFSMEEEDFEAFLTLREYLAGLEDIGDDWEDLELKYRKIYITAICEASEISKENKANITDGDEEIRCTLVTLETDTETMASVLQDVLEDLMKDEDFTELIERAYITEYEQDSVYDAIDDVIDDLEEVEDQNVVMDFYITRSGKRIAQVDLEIGKRTDNSYISVFLGEKLSDTDRISFSYGDGDDYGVSAEYEIKADTKSEYSAKLTVEITSGGMSVNAFSATLKWDKKNGDYTLKSNYCKITGTCTEKGRTHTYTVDKVKLTIPYLISEGDGDWDDLNIVIVLNERDSGSKAPKFTDFTTLEEDELTDLLDDLEDMNDEVNKLFGAEDPYSDYGYDYDYGYGDDYYDYDLGDDDYYDDWDYDYPSDDYGWSWEEDEYDTTY